MSNAIFRPLLKLFLPSLSEMMNAKLYSKIMKIYSSSNFGAQFSLDKYKAKNTND